MNIYEKVKTMTLDEMAKHYEKFAMAMREAIEEILIRKGVWYEDIRNALYADLHLKDWLQFEWKEKEK